MLFWSRARKHQQGFCRSIRPFVHKELFSRLSETPSLLDLRHTLGNDSVLQCALHQYLNGSHWYSVILNWLFKTHLTPSYRLFSAQDATLVFCFGAPMTVAAIRRLQEPFPRLVGRRFPSLFRASFWDTVGGGVPTARGIGRHPSMPSA